MSEREDNVYDVIVIGAGMQVERVRQQLSDEHPDATLLVNAAGFFLPKPFLDYDGADYDVYAELGRAIFFLTQTVARGMVAAGRGGAIVNIGSMWAHQVIGATRRRGTRWPRAGCTPSPATWPTPSPSCCPRPPAGSPAPSGTSTAASWLDATDHRSPPVRRPDHPAHGPRPIDDDHGRTR